MNPTLLYLFINWIIIICAVLAGSRFPSIYPLSFVVIANRQFANYLIGHDGVHGAIVKNNFSNNMISKLFCLFPIYISFETYKKYHLSHHEFLGTNLDPDKKLYNFYPINRMKFFKNMFFYFLKGGMFKDFFIYYTPFYVIYKSKSIKKIIEGDTLEYLAFNLLLISLVIYFKIFFYFFIFWLFPLLIFIPYYYFIGALQHGLIDNAGDGINGRNIHGNIFLMELFLPCASNYHGIHHQYPEVAFYNLRKIFHKKGEKSSNYFETVRALLPGKQGQE